MCVQESIPVKVACACSATRPSVPKFPSAAPVTLALFFFYIGNFTLYIHGNVVAINGSNLRVTETAHHECSHTSSWTESNIVKKLKEMPSISCIFFLNLLPNNLEHHREEMISSLGQRGRCSGPLPLRSLILEEGRGGRALGTRAARTEVGVEGRREE